MVVTEGWGYKLQRAKQHATAIDNAAQAVCAAVLPSAAVLDYSRDNSWHPLYWREVPLPDPMWGTWVGDLLHNARSALDHLVYRIVEVETGARPPETCAFPILDDETDWSTRITNRPAARGPNPTEGMTAEALDWVRTSQPFASGTSALALLRRLSNRDKHRFLYTGRFYLANRVSHFALEPKGVLEVDRFKSAAPGAILEDWIQFGRIRLKAPPPQPIPPFAMTCQIAVGLTFTDRDGEPVVTLAELKEMLAHVTDVVLDGDALLGDLQLDAVAPDS